MKFPVKLQHKIDKRKQSSSLRHLSESNTAVDFVSNDYLGFARCEEIYNRADKLVKTHLSFKNGSTGSRLLSGNYSLYKEVETQLSKVHKSEAALIFNSGYSANLGFFACLPQREDIVLYDELIHASIRDGIQLSKARSYKFKHNNLQQLEEKLALFAKTLNKRSFECYVITESVFSMDGDTPNLKALVALCEQYSANIIVDEAHALGIYGKYGLGLVQELNLEKRIFARIITFGKALGCYGAAVLGSAQLIQFLLNFCRSFIYTTGLPPHTLASVKAAYAKLLDCTGAKQRELLQQNISYFNNTVKKTKLPFISTKSAVQSCIISGNKKTKALAKHLQNSGFNIKPILAPTVPAGSERLRFCLHSYNSKEQIAEVLYKLSVSLLHYMPNKG
ncbi:MAG: aminotransferase class I/II-fold pyridoxal phosphate-dependent enzyme [Tenacibaculum sp.]